VFRFSARMIPTVTDKIMFQMEDIDLLDRYQFEQNGFGDVDDISWGLVTNARLKIASGLGDLLMVQKRMHPGEGDQ
jgi:hypothetical protein